MAFALEVLVDLLGCVGAILVAIPFYRDASQREMLDWLGGTRRIPGFDKAIERAEILAARSVLSFEPKDRLCVGWGLTIIALSYLLHIFTLVIHALEHRS